MPLPSALQGRLSLPVIAAPMFLVSGPDLVTQCCISGVTGTFPALNQRSTEGYSQWLTEIKATLAEHESAAPFGVNLIVHRTNPRLEADLKVTVEEQVPLVITSLGAVPELVDAVHSYGGLVFHDVTNMRHAEKAIEANVDGLILVSAGAGGHAGTLHPYSFIQQIKQNFNTCVIQSGAISTGAQVLASICAGADIAYMGTRFIATQESMAEDDYKKMLINATAEDIVYTAKISGIPANFLAASLQQNGIDLKAAVDPDIDLGKELIDEAKAWKTIWSAGHGTGNIHDTLPVADLCQRLRTEYNQSLSALKPL
ncbi:2-nitropropane dioxygenase [Chromatiales bacterium (ex Bugula neritina AB1)]|nr:2-nitropropane dioxygenase [Chromatiales bacterium (ex Bugula neritina AB1)]